MKTKEEIFKIVNGSPYEHIADKLHELEQRAEKAEYDLRCLQHDANCIEHTPLRPHIAKLEKVVEVARRITVSRHSSDEELDLRLALFELDKLK